MVFNKDKKETQLRAIRRAVDMGVEIQSVCPYISDLYRAGLSHASIAKYLKAQSPPGLELSISKGILENAVRYALSGNENPDLIGTSKPVKTYEGLITLEEYALLSEQNRVSSGEARAADNKKRNIGALALSKTGLVDAARESAKARGFTPFSDEEAVYTMWASTDSNNKKNGQNNNSRIAEEVNKHYKKNRNFSAIRELLRRERTKARKSG